MTETTANGFKNLTTAQTLAYYRRHETADVIKALYDEKVRGAYEAYFRDAIDAAHAAAVKASIKLPKSVAIAALAHAHAVGFYGALDLILVSLGREKTYVPYTEPRAFEILKRLDDTSPALWINESICAKGTHIANHVSADHPFYRKFMVEQEMHFGNQFVVFDQARQCLECSPQPGMPHHCEAALAPSMWLYKTFGTSWVKRARAEYGLVVMGVSTIGLSLDKVGPCRTIDEMAQQWCVKPGHITSVPHYDKSTGRNSGRASEMLELTLMKMNAILRPGQPVDTVRLRALELLHSGMMNRSQICVHDRQPSTCKVCSACPHGRRRYDCKECGGSQNLRARSSAQTVQGVRRGLNLRARSSALSVQGVRWVSNLPARSCTLYVQGVRWVSNLPAQSCTLYVQGVRWVSNLPARSSALSVQGVRWVSNLPARSSALSVQGVRRGINLRARP